LTHSPGQNDKKIADKKTDDITAKQRQVEVLRYLYLGLFVTFMVIFFGQIFTTNHSVTYWILLSLLMLLILAWSNVASIPAGRRLLSSQFAGRFTLVWVSVLVVLIALELFVRTDYSKFHVFGAWPNGDQAYPVTRNAAGFRDVDHEVEKTPGVTRVLILGDSFTHGEGVSQTDYYSAQLRELAGPTFEFIIAARRGASTVDQLSFVEEYGCQFAPDVVMVGVVMNDIQGIPGVPVQQEDWHGISRHFAVLRLPYMLEYYIGRLGDELGLRYTYRQWEEDIFDSSQPWVDRWQVVASQLAETVSECGAEHLYAFTLPYAEANVPEMLAVTEMKHEMSAAVFDQAGFVTVNLLPAYLEEFGDRPPRLMWALPNDPHPNAEIHHWYAGQMWSRLSEDLRVEE
jgi:hypothetical protein